MTCAVCAAPLLEVHLAVGALYAWRWQRCQKCAQAIGVAASRSARMICARPSRPCVGLLSDPIEVTIEAGELFTWGWRRCSDCAHRIGRAAVAAAGRQAPD